MAPGAPTLRTEENLDDFGEDDGSEANKSTEVQALPMTPTAQTSVPAFDTLEWRREYKIHLREEEWRRRQDQLIRQKRVSWEVSRMEKVNRIAAAREAATQRVLEERIREENVQVEREYRERCREMEIQKRESRWQQSVAQQVIGQIEDANQREREFEARVGETKAQAFEQAKIDAKNRAEETRRLAELEARREANIARRDAERLQKGAEHAREIRAQASRKTEVRAEISGPQHRRCVLIQPQAPKPAKEGVEEIREANIKKKERERRDRELARLEANRSREAEHGLLAKFKGPTEQAILRGERSIFEKPILPSRPEDGPMSLLLCS